MDWQMLAAAAGIIVVLANAGKVILNIVKPAWKLGRKVADSATDVAKLDEWQGGAETRLTALEQKSKNDFVAIQDVQKAIKVLCGAMLALLDHEITGNHIDRLEAAKEHIREYLIER